MAAKSCYICEEAIIRGEPRLVVSGLLIHEHCFPEAGDTCDTEDCQWRWTVHAGECVT